MGSVLSNPGVLIAMVLAVGGLFVIALRVRGFFNHQAWLRNLGELRKRMAELQPTDPEYNQARALYTSLMNDGKMWDYHFAHQSSEGHNASGHSDSASDHSHHSDHGHHGGDVGGDGHHS